ncbi:MAG TPA: Flp pilus assembly protein CpaB [Bryobacteraceae bacterium]|nr:Flp pilus assembly protein CpaB [Bryobacteraceae bacterium]
MSKRLLSVLAFALVVSLGASILIYRLVSSQVSRGGKPATTQVLVAARNLPVGTLIGEGDLRTGDWSGPVPTNALLKREDAVGRGVVASIYEGEPLLDARLAAKGAGAGLSATIPPGMRAVAIRVNEVVGVAGFVVPGQRVDVLVLGMPPGGSSAVGTITKTILQNIEVLSAGQNIQKDNEGKPVTVQVVNVLVTPEQAEVLSLISNDMRIQLILRNPLDTKETKTSGTAAASIFSGVAYKGPAPSDAPRPVRSAPQPKPVAVAAAPERPAAPVVVEVFQGSRKSEVKFQEQKEQARSAEERQ